MFDEFNFNLKQQLFTSDKIIVKPDDPANVDVQPEQQNDNNENQPAEAATLPRHTNRERRPLKRYDNEFVESA